MWDAVLRVVFVYASVSPVLWKAEVPYLHFTIFLFFLILEKSIHCAEMSANSARMPFGELGGGAVWANGGGRGKV